MVIPKVSHEDVSRRYKQEAMEFGCPSPMFTILATLAMLNLFSFTCSVKREAGGIPIRAIESLALLIIIKLCSCSRQPVSIPRALPQGQGDHANLCQIQISRFSIFAFSISFD